MKRETMKLIAVVCCIAYLAAYLFLPFIAVMLVGVGLSGIRAITLSVWCYLPLIAAIAMAFCSYALPGKTAGIINIVGAFIPLIVYFIMRETFVTGILRLLGLADLVGSTVKNYVLTVGAGVIISMILGLGAAAFCFLSENAQAPAQHTAGFGASDNDEW